jgi:hypothetical protein
MAREPNAVGHHVAHHVAVVILARPDEAALRTDHAGHRVVYEGVEILDPGGFKLLPVLGVKDVLEDVLEGMVVPLGNGVLGGKPQLLSGIEGVLEAGPGKGRDGGNGVELPLQHTRAVEVVDGLSALLPVGAGKDQLALPGPGTLYSAAL